MSRPETTVERRLCLLFDALIAVELCPVVRRHAPERPGVSLDEADDPPVQRLSRPVGELADEQQPGLALLSTQYIRHHSTPLYTPEPDVVHEMVGHAVTLASGRLAELNRLVGRAVRRAQRAEELERLSRVYWFTIEFGVLREDGRLKAYGTGLLSSAGELEAMHRAELRTLDLEEASRQEYDPTHFQPVLFCANSFEEMHAALKQYLVRSS